MILDYFYISLIFSVQVQKCVLICSLLLKIETSFDFNDI